MKYFKLFVLINLFHLGLLYLIDIYSTVDLISILESKSPDVTLKVYKEDFSEEASKGVITKIPGGFRFNYTKSPAKELAFTAAYFYTEKLNLDFKDYDYLTLELEAKNAKRIPVSIVLMHNDSLLRLVTEFIPVSSGVNTYKLPLSAFKTPPDWFEGHFLSENSVPKKERLIIEKIAIKSCHLLPKGISDEYIITKVTFEKSWSNILLVVVTINIIAVLVLMGYLYKKKKEKIIHVPITPLDVKNRISTIDKIAEYMGKNYSNASLSMLDVQQNVGVGQKKIAEEIKLHFGLSFPQYLAKIRIEESKRLLLARKDQTIAEIAFAVGFNSSSNFNRVFKKIENISPKEYLEGVS